MYSNAVKVATQDFVNKYGQDIITAITDTGLFFMAVVGQKCLESNYGKSELASKYNNFAGIKNFGSLTGAGTVVLDTMETGPDPVSQPFATFDTPLQGFQAYVRVLQDPTKKYTSMSVFTATTPKDQIINMAKAGYTVTAPDKYYSMMKGIIDACTDLYPYGKVESNSPNTMMADIFPPTKIAGAGTLLAIGNQLSSKFK